MTIAHAGQASVNNSLIKLPDDPPIRVRTSVSAITAANARWARIPNVASVMSPARARGSQPRHERQDGNIAHMAMRLTRPITPK